MSNLVDVELKEFDVSGLDGTYKSFGSATAGPVVKLQFINPSDVDVYVGVGAVSKYRVPSAGTITFDELTERNAENGQAAHWPKGTQFQVTQVTAAGTGTLIGHIIVEA